MKFPGVAAVPRRFCNSLGSWNALWGSRSDLGAISERSWELPGSSWSALGLSRDPPGVLLGAPGAPLDASRSAPGSSWGRLGALLGAPGPPGGGPELRFPQFSSVFLGCCKVSRLRPQELKSLISARTPRPRTVFLYRHRVVYILIYISIL